MPTVAQLRLGASVYYALQWEGGDVALVAAVVTTIYSGRALAQSRIVATLHSTPDELASNGAR